MEERSIGRVVDAVTQLEGEGMVVRRSIPHAAFGAIDPFLLLDHMGPRDHGPGEAKGAPDHPHRGFETVTYILEGTFEHKDSQGNHGLLGPGDVQWMTAGDGVVHSEMPSRDIREKGGRMHGLQLWVNLPAADKRMRPRYQDIRADRIPEVDVHGGKIRVIAGAFGGKGAVIATRTPITYLHALLEPGATVRLPVPAGHQGFAYAIAGKGTVGGKRIHEAQLAHLGPDGKDDTTVTATAEAPLSLLLVTGRPLREPTVQWGPFVMTNREEILEAVRDYQSGRFGTIEADVVADTGRATGS